MWGWGSIFVFYWLATMKLKCLGMCAYDILSSILACLQVLEHVCRCWLSCARVVISPTLVSSMWCVYTHCYHKTPNPFSFWQPRGTDFPNQWLLLVRKTIPSSEYIGYTLLTLAGPLFLVCKIAKLVSQYVKYCFPAERWMRSSLNSPTLFILMVFSFKQELLKIWS